MTLRVMSVSLDFTLGNVFYLILFLISAVEQTRPALPGVALDKLDIRGVHRVPCKIAYFGVQINVYRIA